MRWNGPNCCRGRPVCSPFSKKRRARRIGQYAGTWAEQRFKGRGPQAIRILHGLLSLAEKHPMAQLERACQQAIQYGAWRLRDVRELLSRSPSGPLSFLEKHPLIRDLEAYDNLVPVCFDPSQPSTINPQPNHESLEP